VPRHMEDIIIENLPRDVEYDADSSASDEDEGKDDGHDKLETKAARKQKSIPIARSGRLLVPTTARACGHLAHVHPQPPAGYSIVKMTDWPLLNVLETPPLHFCIRLLF
jgi:hypothetical protein